MKFTAGDRDVNDFSEESSFAERKATIVFGLPPYRSGGLDFPFSSWRSARFQRVLRPG